jgi:stage IV sporulation protein FB
MLGMPSATPYDLRFRLLGIPVRVHPLFWLVAALLGGVGTSTVDQVLIWVACVFLSILVHEYGHGLMARSFGYQAGIVLYGMGGLCYSEAERQTPGQRLAVLIAGPGAGFALFGLIVLGVYARYGVTPLESLSLIGIGRQSPLNAIMKMRSAGVSPIIAIIALMEINLYWGILNLLPIWPLDGGQITSVVLTQANPRHGRRWTHVISLLTAGTIALLSYMMWKDMFRALFFGFFAITNYQVLQVIHAQARYGGFEGDEDWWKR